MGETGEIHASVSTSEKPKKQPSSRNLKRKFSAEEEESLENNSRGLRRWVHSFCSYSELAALKLQ